MEGRRIVTRAARTVVVAAALAGALALARPAAAAVFQDPAGDSGTAPDVTSVAVTNDAAARITFRLALANRPNGLEASEAAVDLVYLFLDTDGSASTGDADGDDYFVQFSAQGIGIARWTGSAYTGAARTSARVAQNGGALTLTIPNREVGRTRAFGLSVVSVRIAGATLQSGETGPDTGRWAYTLTRFCVAPDVRGMTLAAAKRAVRAADCAVGRTTRRTAPRAAGRVVGQSPRAGSVRPRGSRVELVVSRGRRP